MLASNRVIWKDNSTLKDLSTKLNNYFSETQVMDIVAAQDKVYIGSDVPFNHRYFSLSVVNAASSTVSVDIWNGEEWVPAIDVLDFTQATAGKSLSQSGIIAWTTDREEVWCKEYTTEDMTDSGIETLKIYNMYWVRLTFSADVTGTMALKYVGHKFSKDEDLNGRYPDINRSTVMAAFQTGKTNWEEQHIVAAEEVFQWLRSHKAAWTKNQIFEWEPFTQAAVHCVAKIVYNAFGEDYETRRDNAENEFQKAMSSVLSQGIDQDEDGHKDEEEHAGYSVSLRRV